MGSTWICSICAHAHQGDVPPEQCPLCGAPASHFERGTPQTTVKAIPPRAWRCLICGFRHEGPQPPEGCPVCAAGPMEFEPWEPESEAQAGSQDLSPIVIIGGGIAGLSAAEAIREASCSARITLLTSEEEPPYHRLNLTRYLAGELPREALTIRSEAWFKDQRIELVLGAEALCIDRAAQEVHCRDGSVHAYARLILASGAHAFVPPIEGLQRRHVHSLRTRLDAEAVLGALRPGMHIAVVGGGILGLEAAAAMVRREALVTVIESGPRLLPRQLDETGSTLLEHWAESLGISLRRNARTEAVLGDESVSGLRFTDGGELEADLVVVAAGVRANTWLAREAGLAVDQGVAVDDLLFTSDPNILAAGDISTHRGVNYGTWGPAQAQGRLAGFNALGLARRFEGLPRTNMLKVLGIDLFSIGSLEPQDGASTLLTHREGAHYQLLHLRDELLVGALLLGNASLSSMVKEAISSRLILRTSPAEGFHAVAEELRERCRGPKDSSVTIDLPPAT